MSESILLGLVGIITAVINGLFITFQTIANKRLRTPPEPGTERRDTIADREALIAIQNKENAELNQRLDAQDKKIEAQNERLQQLQDRNNELVSFTYKLIHIVRDCEKLDLIDPTTIPKGIYIYK